MRLLYQRYFKRVLDVCVSLAALVVLSPLLVVLTVGGAAALGGNPFFVQRRPGREEKIFSLIKFRTMRDLRGSDGALLPDERRLTAYGKLLRRTSLDELPELLNVLLGEMSLVGPRPLVPQYLPWYTPEEHRRHSVRPGMTGLAQVSGRNTLTWESRFACDLDYIDHITLQGDVKILLLTVKKVLKREGVVLRGTGTVGDLDACRRGGKEHCDDITG